MDNFINNIKEFNNVKGKLGSFITFMVFDTSTESILALINAKIKLANTIKDAYKKKQALDRIFKIKEDFKDYPEDFFKNNGILYLVNEELNKFIFPNEVLKVARQEFKSSVLYDHGDYYEIEYIVDILTNFTYYNLLLIEKSAHLYHFNKNKTKLLATCKLNEEDLDKSIRTHFSGQYVLGGNGNFKTNFFKDNESNILAEFKLSGYNENNIDSLKDQVIEYYLDKEEEESLEKLGEFMGYLEKYADTIVVNNKHIFQFVENYAVKTLFIHKSTKLYQRLSELDPAMLNSIDNVYYLFSQKPECKSFLENYKGALAEMRYQMPEDCFD